MTSNPSNPHDVLVRKLLSDPDDAAAAIRAVVPEDIERSLDWEAMKRVDASFVSADLSTRYSDLLFRTNLTREPRAAYVYLLIEHQSSPDALMAFRILEYQVSIIRKHLRDCAKQGQKVKRIPAVLPLVIHAGPKGLRWNAPLEVGDLFDLDPETHTAMRDYLPRMRYLLDDTNQIDTSALLARRGTPRSRLGMILVKTAGQGRKSLPDILFSLVDDIREILDGPNGKEDFETLVTYIDGVGDLTTDELAALADQLGPVAKEILMTTAERYRTEGRAELLLKLLTRKFGPISPAIERKIRAADTDQVDTWAEQILTASTIDEALA